MTNESELKAWRIGALLLVLLAAFVFLTERIFGQFFDVVLETCIFYIPAVTSVVLLLYFTRRLGVKTN